MISDLISSQREHIQSLKVVEAISNFSDVVGVEGKVLELGQLVKTFNCLDLVEGEVKPLDVHQFFKIFDLANDVVV